MYLHISQLFLYIFLLFCTWVSWILPGQAFSLPNNSVFRLQCVVHLSCEQHLEWDYVSVKLMFILFAITPFSMCWCTISFSLFWFLQNYSLAAGTPYPNLIRFIMKNVCPWHGKMSNGNLIAFFLTDVERILVWFQGRVAALEWELTVNLPTIGTLNMPRSAVVLAGVCGLFIKTLTHSIGCILWD